MQDNANIHVCHFLPQWFQHHIITFLSFTGQYVVKKSYLNQIDDQWTSIVQGIYKSKKQ